MSDSAVQAQWDLNGTSGTAWETLRGFMMASTSDNVQPLALMACERFGGTLAMSHETTNKVQHVLLPSEPAPISFIKAKVGFSRNDCATKLGKSTAGLRFLGLAAALVTSLGAFEGAKALELMLKRITNDATSLPTVRHLKEVLTSLEARSSRCGFTELFVTWQMLLRKEALSPPLFPSQSPRNPPSFGTTPSLEAIAGLVDVFCQVALGPATVIGATIKTGSAAPWVLAFAQWCVEPPSVFLGDRAVVERPESRIRVVLSNDTNQPLEVSIHHQVKELTPLLLAPPPTFNAATGMVTVKVYGTWLLPELGFDDGAVPVLRESLQYAIPQLLRKMKCGRFARLGQGASSGRWRGRNDKTGTPDSFCLSPLPDIRTIAATCTTFLALEDPIEFTIPDDSTLVAGLPLVARYLASLEQHCRCQHCLRGLEEGSGPEWCSKQQFFRSLSFIIMDIFGLSLFDSTSTLLLRLSVDRENGIRMEMRVSDVLRTGNSQDFDDLDLIAWARNMAGHVLQGGDSVVISSSKGQVIYPRVFDTLRFGKQGYLELCCLSGVLRYGGEAYDVVSYTAADMRGVGNQPEYGPVDFTRPVSRPLNLCGRVDLEWSISILDNQELRARLSLDTPFWIHEDPLSLLRNMKNTLLVDGCPHDPRAKLERADRFASYSRPWERHPDPPETSSHVYVVAADSADGLRCFTLAYEAAVPIVLRKNSCLGCCLKVCRDNDIHILIL